MNEPVDCSFTDDDILMEYKRFGDVKRVAAAFCMDAKAVKQILKKEEINTTWKPELSGELPIFDIEKLL